VLLFVVFPANMFDEAGLCSLVIVNAGSVPVLLSKGGALRVPGGDGDSSTIEGNSYKMQCSTSNKPEWIQARQSSRSCWHIHELERHNKRAG
jgi:hypothetical protein